MLNIAIFDPWQRSLFSRQQTPGKEPLLAGNYEVDMISAFDELMETYSQQENELIRSRELSYLGKNGFETMFAHSHNSHINLFASKIQIKEKNTVT